MSVSSFFLKKIGWIGGCWGEVDIDFLILEWNKREDDEKK